jgi:cysteine desulfurase/selenocysteine lyase
MRLDVKKIRQDFPILEKKTNGKRIVYFDNACQTLRPVQVIDKMNEYYSDYPACAGRSAHKLGRRVEEEVKKAREKVAKFFGAKANEIIFTRNTTESINLVAMSMAWREGDVVILSDKEHNSNLIPWQQLKRNGVAISRFKFGDVEDLEKQLDKNGKKVRLVSMVHTSNVDGTSNPIEKLSRIAHDNGSLVLVDAAQSAPHKEINVKRMGADFLACSGHKMLGPSGMGALYASEKAVDQLDTFMVGGDTVRDTSYDTAVFEKPPEKFEAGLQNYSGIVGFGEAVEYLSRVGMESIHEHEIKLNKRITDALYDKIELLGPREPAERGGIFSFNIKGLQYHDIALLLDQSADIMIRSGMHCAHSWFHAHKLDGSARASLYLYNTEEECDAFINEIGKITKLKK